MKANEALTTGPARSPTNAGNRPATRVLLAEDDDEMRMLVSRALQQAGFKVTECDNGIQLLDKLSAFLTPQPSERYDMIIADVRMPGLTCLEVFAGLHDRPGFPPTVVITAFGDVATRAEAEEYHAAAFFDKPFEIDELVECVCRIVPPRPGEN
jgi:DNA-binding response OmpR family regulator